MNKISNYRPISILPYFSKFFENVMHKQLMDYFTKTNSLSPQEFGFRKQHSTFMALLKILARILEYIDSKELAIGNCFDLSKAFDTVNHNILLNKLGCYGIR